MLTSADVSVSWWCSALLNVEAVQLFFELEGAEGDLSLRHCLHLNVNSSM